MARWIGRALALVACTGTLVLAQDSMKDWLARILDPASVGMTMPEGATLNRKITVDTIRYDREHPERKIAVYMVPIDKLGDARAHVTRTLGIEPLSGTDAKGFERHLFDCTGPAKCPAPSKGLVVTIFRSPWVDGMAQIQLEHPRTKP
jgi:hypothetical protein